MKTFSEIEEKLAIYNPRQDAHAQFIIEQLLELLTATDARLKALEKHVAGLRPPS